MIISDPVYGESSIEDRVLIELIESQPIQRLKNISQYGIPDEFFLHKNFSRFEHSVGVMLLLQKLGAGREEQVAGLLHDVSHLAFSHVADWVFGSGINGDEGLQDSLLEEFIRESEVASILEINNYPVEQFVDLHQFSLLEQAIPNLCADRVDYALREMYWSGFIDGDVIRYLISRLIVIKSQIAFADEMAALKFSQQFLRLQSEHWGSDDTVMRYYRFSRLLKRSLDRGILRKEDFFEDESLILSKLNSLNSGPIYEELRLLRDKNPLSVNKMGTKLVSKKFRYIDPPILIDEEVKRLSEVNADYRWQIVKEKSINQKGLFVE